MKAVNGRDSGAPRAHRRACGVWAAVPLCCVLFSGFLPGGSVIALGSPESQLRAAMIINILRFTANRPHDSETFRLCLADTPPSAGDLQALHGQGETRQLHVSNSRRLAVSLLPDDEGLLPAAAGCDALVIGPDVPSRQQLALVKQSQTSSTILVCDNCQDAQQAHVALLRKGDRLGFSVDVDLAQQSQVTFSAQLLKLASTTKQ